MFETIPAPWSMLDFRSWYIRVVPIWVPVPHTWAIKSGMNNGHFRNLNWRYLPYIRPIFQASVREYPHKIWPYMVQYLHFRILKFPLNTWTIRSGMNTQVFLYDRPWATEGDRAYTVLPLKDRASWICGSVGFAVVGWTLCEKRYPAWLWLT